MLIDKPSFSVGNYVVQLVPTFQGIPPHSALWIFAACMVPDADGPVGRSILVVKFGGTRLLKGEPYAVVVFRLGDGVFYAPLSPETTCTKSVGYFATGDAPFKHQGGDITVSVLVA